jgi:hypothetical protein
VGSGGHNPHPLNLTLTLTLSPVGWAVGVTILTPDPPNTP